MSSVQKDWERLTLLLARAVRDINEDRCIGGTSEITELAQRLCDHSGPTAFRYRPLGGLIVVCGTCGVERPEVQHHPGVESLLRKPGPPDPGCHCQTACMAPVVMGTQTPCRDLEKRARFAKEVSP